MAGLSGGAFYTPTGAYGALEDVNVGSYSFGGGGTTADV